jgi:hypothetical protein
MMSGAGTWGGQIREVPELAGRLPKVKIPRHWGDEKKLNHTGHKRTRRAQAANHALLTADWLWRLSGVAPSSVGD